MTNRPWNREDAHRVARRIARRKPGTWVIDWYYKLLTKYGLWPKE